MQAKIFWHKISVFSIFEGYNFETGAVLNHILFVSAFSELGNYYCLKQYYLHYKIKIIRWNNNSFSYKQIPLAP